MLEDFPQDMKLMVDFVSKVNPFEDDEKFFEGILKVTAEMVKKAEYGVLFQIKENSAFVKASFGYDKNVKKISFASFLSLLNSPCETENEEWKRAVLETTGVNLKESLSCLLFSEKNEKFIVELGTSKEDGFSQGNLKKMRLFSHLTHNILRVRGMGKSLDNEREIYKSILEKSHDSIIIFDNGKLLFVNEEVSHLTGYSKEELLTMNAWDVVHPKDLPRLMKYHERRKKGDESPKEYTAVIVRKDGKERLCHFNTKTIYLNGEPVMLASLRDITEEERAKEKLEAANLELKKAYKRMEDLNLRFQNISALLAKMGISEMSENEFLNQVLKSTLQVVPVAKYGSLSLIEGDEWRFVATVGHDLQKLKNLHLKREYILSGNDKVVDNILEFDERVIPPSLLEKFKDAVLPIKQTIMVPLDLSGNKEGFLCVDIPRDSEERFSTEDVKAVESFSKIASAFYILRKYSRAQEEMKNKIIMMLTKILEKYDPYTEGHSERVANCSVRMAKRLGFSEDELKKIWQESILHDVGKLFVPLEILNKEEKLTLEEFEEIKKHPLIGAEIIKEGAQLHDIALIVKCHHERWDGKGYPQGIAGEEIPINSRIMAICDAYDAMTSDRAYRRAKKKEDAIEEIRKNAGKQFDPNLVGEFLKMIKDVENFEH